MSTENEGAATTSAAGPQTESPATGVPETPRSDAGSSAPADTPAADTPAAGSSAAPAAPPAPAVPDAPAAPPASSASAASSAAPPVPPAGAPASPGAHEAAASAGAPGATAQQPAVSPEAAGAPTGAWYNAAGAPLPYGPPPGGPAGPGGPGAPWGMPAQPPRRKGVGGLLAAVVAAALVAGGIGGGIGYWAATHNDNGSTTISAAADPKVQSRTPGSVADIASKALPSVVTIEAQSNSGDGGTGTGFVYDKQGHILTNNHVVASAADGGKLSVTFSNGKQYDAEVIGRAQGYDVAVIKLKNPSGATLNPLPLGDSDKAAVGDATVAIGAPFGLSGTVTTGIVSAKNRPVASSDGGGGGASSYMSALQTDASINPGNSGGPLLNSQGAVIGINSAIQSAGNGGGLGGGQGQSGSIGLGFAIPINQAKNVAEQLIKTGQPVYPVIEATVNMKDSGGGAKIASSGSNGDPAVTPGGPADKAGLKPGDVITRLDDTKIDSGPTLISEIWTHQPGTKVTVTYVRDGKQATTQVTLGERRGDK
ncbi:S1C family serine protease [Streptomyces orinoci]|uniref:Trypsin-like peptidase domain-containing protein n=1 Tax=Streptomyces orinoci TaxID=67339 RepID=A0ABV3K315_STRON|nr:trypsin-like peptidase domain-containing protein [Streptomyces orinoci]